jgi:hypothetical protein
MMMGMVDLVMRGMTVDMPVPKMTMHCVFKKYMGSLVMNLLMMVRFREVGNVVVVVLGQDIRCQQSMPR